MTKSTVAPLTIHYINQRRFKLAKVGFAMKAVVFMILVAVSLAGCTSNAKHSGHADKTPSQLDFERELEAVFGYRSLAVADESCPNYILANWAMQVVYCGPHRWHYYLPRRDDTVDVYAYDRGEYKTLKIMPDQSEVPTNTEWPKSLLGVFANSRFCVVSEPDIDCGLDWKIDPFESTIYYTKAGSPVFYVGQKFVKENGRLTPAGNLRGNAPQTYASGIDSSPIVESLLRTINEPQEMNVKVSVKPIMCTTSSNGVTMCF